MVIKYELLIVMIFLSLQRRSQTSTVYIYHVCISTGGRTLILIKFFYHIISLDLNVHLISENTHVVLKM